MADEKYIPGFSSGSVFLYSLMRLPSYSPLHKFFELCFVRYLASTLLPAGELETGKRKRYRARRRVVKEETELQDDEVELIEETEEGEERKRETENVEVDNTQRRVDIDKGFAKMAILCQYASELPAYKSIIRPKKMEDLKAMVIRDRYDMHTLKGNVHL